MAAGPPTYFNAAKGKTQAGLFALLTDSIKVALVTSSQSFDVDFVGTSTDCRYSDITAEVVGTGYTAGGFTLGTKSITVSNANDNSVFTAANISAASCTFVFKWLIFYDDTSPNKNLIAFCDGDTGGGSITVTGATLAINWNASGISALA